MLAYVLLSQIKCLNVLLWHEHMHKDVCNFAPLSRQDLLQPKKPDILTLLQFINTTAAHAACTALCISTQGKNTIHRQPLSLYMHVYSYTYTGAGIMGMGRDIIAAFNSQLDHRLTACSTRLSEDECGGNGRKINDGSIEPAVTVQHIRHRRPAPHCTVLPPVEFNGVILRAISRLSGSSITTAVFVHVARRSTTLERHTWHRMFWKK